jgi:Mitochondrial ribosomal protein (VAR1)
MKTEAFYKLEDKREKNLIRIKQSIKKLSKYADLIKNKSYKMIYSMSKIQNDPNIKNINMDVFKLFFSKIKEVKQLKNIYNESKNITKEIIGKRDTKFLYYKNFIKNYTLKYKIKFIFKLQKIISKFYNKKVIFNIILLKNYYLNSNILTQILAHKSKNRDNKIYRTFKKTLVRIRVPILKKNTISRTEKEKFNQNINIKHTIKEKRKINPTIVRYYKKNNNLLNRLNNKTIIGVRLESAGRLTRRFTAQRAIKKIKYIGTLQTTDSSLKMLPSQMVRNNITSSLQYSKVKSQNRIGSFGIKG